MGSRPPGETGATTTQPKFLSTFPEEPSAATHCARASGWSKDCSLYRASDVPVPRPLSVVAQRLSWSQLLPGIGFVAAVIAAVFAVLVYGRVGALRGERVRLHIVAAETGDIMAGSDVWYAGRKVGRVESIGAMPVSGDSLARVAISTEILDEYAPLVHRDAIIRVQAGGRLMGAKVVAIEGGSLSAPAIADGDTLRSLPGGSMATAQARMATAQERVPLLMRATRGAIADMRQILQLTSTAMARVPIDRGRAVMAQATDVAGDVQRMMGTSDGALGARIAVVRARVDSVRAVMASPSGTFGRFRRDSTLVHAIADVRDELSALSAAASSPDGTLGRMAADSLLQNELSVMKREMSALFLDIKKRPLRYLSF